MAADEVRLIFFYFCVAIKALTNFYYCCCFQIHVFDHRAHLYFTATLFEFETSQPLSLNSCFYDFVILLFSNLYA